MQTARVLHDSDSNSPTRSHIGKGSPIPGRTRLAWRPDHVGARFRLTLARAHTAKLGPLRDGGCGTQPARSQVMYFSRFSPVSLVIVLVGASAPACMGRADLDDGTFAGHAGSGNS